MVTSIAWRIHGKTTAACSPPVISKMWITRRKNREFDLAKDVGKSDEIWILDQF